MSINKKGKRKLIFRDQLYYWSLSTVNIPTLTITESNKELFIYYQLDQNKNYFLKPRIALWTKNKRYKAGRYHLSPPLKADDIFSISDNTIITLLDWFYELPLDARPIDYNTQPHPFEDINFGKGIVEYIKNSFVYFDLIDKENLLSVSFPNYFILDVSWHKLNKDVPYYSQKEFIVCIVWKNDWKNPVFKLDRKWETLRETLINAVKWIDKQ